MGNVVQHDVIDKADIIDGFTTELRNKIKTHLVWYQYSGNPGWGFPTGWMSPYNIAGPTTGALSNSIEAADLTSLIYTWCYEYSKFRKLRFHRTGNISPTDQTQVAAMGYNNATYQVNYRTDSVNYAVTYEAQTGKEVDAAKFNAYMDRLYTRWIDYKNVVYYYNSYYCHSSCHQSCHGSFRFRR